jgi:hypothetical protein
MTMAPDDMTLDRFAVLLDAYGADPARWPDAERAAARALLDRSSEARARRDAAAALDALLDRAATVEPSSALAERILAQAPQRPPQQPKVIRLRARVVAAVGLAAAASLALWLTWRPGAQRTLEPAAVARLGEYQTPTDALLSAVDLDADDTMPEFGCDDPEVDCDDSDLAELRPTASRAHEEMHA